ncbi:WapI family immunity protein [Galactobacter caseinivorans]|nr:hypothetical protein [Galactobacter caseinivorans]
MPTPDSSEMEGTGGESLNVQTAWADDEGHTLYLSVQGYEFPGTTDSQNPDSQWLNIGVRLTAPGFDSRFAEAALTLREAASLGAWWTSLAATAPGELPDPPLTLLDFHEPLLAFGLRSVDQDAVRLAIVLPQSDDEPRIPEAWPDVLEVEADREDLAEAATAWFTALEALPPRS